MTEVFEKTEGCITVASTSWPPMVDISKVPYTGTQVALLRTVMEAMNMCYYLAPTPDQQWGDKLNGTWSGMIGMVGRKEADMAMGPLAVTWLRTEIVHYAAYNLNAENVFLYKVITDIQPDMFLFLKTFQTIVWELIGGSILVMAITAILFHYGFNRARNQVEGGSVEAQGSRLLHGLWSIKVILTQDNSNAPPGDGGRVLTITWMVMSLIISLMYRCNLKAALITREVLPPFDSMEEFVEQTDYKWVIVDGTYYGGYFKNEHEVAPNTARGRMWPMQYLPPIKKASEIVSTLIATNEKIAAINPQPFCDAMIAVDFGKHHQCRVTYTKKGFNQFYMAFGYDKNATFRDKMDMVILRLNEGGITDQIFNTFVRDSTYCIKNKKTNNNESRSFTIGDFYGIFIIYGLGVSVSVLAFGIEMAIGKSKEETKDMS